MHTQKFFDTWISRNFKGLSAFTLYQLLSNLRLPEYVDTLVYVDLYNYATGLRDEKHRLIFEGIKEYVDSVEWL